MVRQCTARFAGLGVAVITLITTAGLPSVSLAANLIEQMQKAEQELDQRVEAAQAKYDAAVTAAKNRYTKRLEIFERRARGATETQVVEQGRSHLESLGAGAQNRVWHLEEATWGCRDNRKDVSETIQCSDEGVSVSPRAFVLGGNDDERPRHLSLVFRSLDQAITIKVPEGGGENLPFSIDFSAAMDASVAKAAPTAAPPPVALPPEAAASITGVPRYRYETEYYLLGRSGGGRLKIRSGGNTTRLKYDYSEWRDDAIGVTLLFRNASSRQHSFFGRIAAVKRPIGYVNERVSPLGFGTFTTRTLRPGEVQKIECEIRVDDPSDVGLIKVGDVH